mmetsp:Transcript_39513/g.113684  ORF Transcript_39513/g.113684 Transcript_39513/m.113684 type:complete len:279 (-) Transcript_39513:2002-2838(-)
MMSNGPAIGTACWKSIPNTTSMVTRLLAGTLVVTASSARPMSPEGRGARMARNRAHCGGNLHSYDPQKHKSSQPQEAFADFRANLTSTRNAGSTSFRLVSHTCSNCGGNLICASEAFSRSMNKPIACLAVAFPTKSPSIISTTCERDNASKPMKRSTATALGEDASQLSLLRRKHLQVSLAPATWFCGASHHDKMQPSSPALETSPVLQTRTCNGGTLVSASNTSGTSKKRRRATRPSFKLCSFGNMFEACPLSFQRQHAEKRNPTPMSAGRVNNNVR